MSEETSELYPYGERRLIRRLLRYWQELRNLRTMPEENDIDPDLLGEDWKNCFLLQSRDIAHVIDYNFTYLGENIIRAYNGHVIDHFNPHIIGPNANMLSGYFSQVIESRAALVNEGEFPTLNGHRLMYRQCLMPLGNEDHGVAAIFGGMNYKIW